MSASDTDRAAAEEPSFSNLAFVLLPDPVLPGPGALGQIFARYAPGDEVLHVVMGDQGTDKDAGDVLELQLDSGERSFVALMPAPVPDGEADEGARFSLSSFRGQGELPPHRAHLIVPWQTGAETPPVEQVRRFIAVLASIAEVTDAIGIYWGNAGATHHADFFLSVAAEQDLMSTLALMSGVSIAHEEDGRLSMLSLGMQQLDLPDLLLVASGDSPNDQLATLYDLIGYLAERGEPIPEGQTVGRTKDERCPVRYVPSPIDPSLQVWRVELP